MSVRHLNSADPLLPQKDGVLRLYSMLYCPFAQGVKLVLAHKQVEFETVNINIKEKPTWLFDKNPGGEAPILEQDNKIVYDSDVCMEYVDESFPGPKLTPSDPYTKARGKMLCGAYSQMIWRYFDCIYAHHYGGRKEAAEKFSKTLAEFEKVMPETPFLTGNVVSMADYSCWPCAERFPTMVELVDLDPLRDDLYPRVCSWYARMAETPGVQATRTDTAALAYFANNYYDDSFDFDFALKK